jgi:hypothetical protein
MSGPKHRLFISLYSSVKVPPHEGVSPQMTPRPSPWHRRRTRRTRACTQAWRPLLLANGQPDEPRVHRVATDSDVGVMSGGGPFLCCSAPVHRSILCSEVVRRRWNDCRSAGTPTEDLGSRLRHAEYGFEIVPCYWVRGCRHCA